jgi:ankyrin repeat protein
MRGPLCFVCHAHGASVQCGNLCATAYCGQACAERDWLGGHHYECIGVKKRDREEQLAEEAKSIIDAVTLYRDTNYEDEGGYEPGASDPEDGELDILSRLSDDNANLVFDAIDPNGARYLPAAVQNENEVLVRRLLAWPGIDVHVESEKNGWTALLHAVQMPWTPSLKRIITMLLAHPDENVNFLHHHGSTALMFAIPDGGDAGSTEAVEYLLSVPDIDVNHANADGTTALLLAASHPNVAWQALALLLKHPGIAVNAPDPGGSTPLMIAVDNSRGTDSTQAVELLLHHPLINVNAQNNRGETALMLAVGNAALLTLLLGHPGIQVNLQAHDRGLTALMIAAAFDDVACVAALARHPNTNFFIKSDTGDIASDFSESRLCKLIIFVAIKSQRWNPLLHVPGKPFPRDISMRLSLTWLRDHLCDAMSSNVNLPDLLVFARMLGIPHRPDVTEGDLCMMISDVLSVGHAWNEQSKMQVNRRLADATRANATFLSAIDAFRRGAAEFAGIDPTGKTVEQLLEEYNAFLQRAT